MEIEERSITFSVQMTVKEMYQFTMYHVYHQASGLIGLDFLSLTRSCVCCILMLLSLNSTCGLPSTAYFFTVSQVLRHYFH